jgi:hypothetical protein
MYKFIVDFLSNHMVVMAMLASLGWFYAGYKDFLRGKQIVGSAWQMIGVLLLLIYSINAALSKEWYSLIIAASGMSVELWLIRRCWRENRLDQRSP